MNPYLPVIDRVDTQPRAPEPEERQLAFSFNGNAKEYFGIWIVNTVLTILTLGIYSAWAKVRSRQYFYRNTLLEGTSFEYLANPVAVLKGRIIAAIALGIVFGSQHYSLTLYAVAIGALVLATPWVLVKALAFNARNSAYRNIRFAFTGNTGEAFGLYLQMLLIYVVSCGLGYPYVQWRMTSFIVTRHLYGDLRPHWTTKAGQYYRTYLFGLLLILPAYGILMAMVLSSVKPGGDPSELQRSIMPGLALFYVYLLIPGAFLQARLANLLYGGVELGPHRLECRQSGWELFKLYVVNLLAIVVSLGLLIPWAKVRLAKYRAACLTLHATGPLTVEKLIDEDASAVGEGLTDLGDFDVGLGV
jgi:uncharacterized membrane protein YjgN (DUF898 family)